MQVQAHARQQMPDFVLHKLGIFLLDDSYATLAQGNQVGMFIAEIEKIKEQEPRAAEKIRQAL